MWTRRRLSIESSFLSLCTLSALVKFLDTQVLPFPQLPNNTKDKWWQKCLVFPDRITQNVIWRRSCLWEILWKTCSSVLDVNYNRTEDKRAVRTVQSSNRGKTNSCYNPVFFFQKYKRISATLTSKTVIGLHQKLWRCGIPFTLEGGKGINVYRSELQPETFSKLRNLPGSISVSCSKPSSCVLGLGLQSPGDERGVMVDARVSGPMSGSTRYNTSTCNHAFLKATALCPRTK